MSAPSSRALWILWGASRSAFFTIWLLLVPNSQRDVTYYFDRLQTLSSVGPASTLVEYPTPVIWLLQIPRLTSFGTPLGYTISFVLWMLLIDFGVAYLLWRRGDNGSRIAMAVWTVFLLFMGATVYLRFDLVTAALAGAALVFAAERRTKLAAVLVAIGAAIKLWPALLWPALLTGDRRTNRATTITFWLSGVGLAVAAWLYSGFHRLITPLIWQSERGLQIESIWASVPMIARAANPSGYEVAISQWQAYEVHGAGVDVWLRLASVATALGLAAIVAAYAGWLRRANRSSFEAAMLMCFIVLVMIATGKTFSPQYLMWLAGPLAASWVVSGQASPPQLKFLRRLTVVLLALTLMTQIIYPIGYGHLVSVGWGTWPVTLVLVLRNAALLATTVWVGRFVYSFTWRRSDA